MHINVYSSILEMSQPPNPYAGGMPGKRTPEMPPNPYHGGHPGQRSPWGHSSPRHFNQYSSSRQVHTLYLIRMFIGWMSLIIEM